MWCWVWSRADDCHHEAVQARELVARWAAPHDDEPAEMPSIADVMTYRRKVTATVSRSRC